MRPIALRMTASALPSLLLVKDTSMGPEPLSEWLVRRGFEVYVASSAGEAIDAAMRVRPGLVLIDLGATAPEGIETARRLRAEPGTAHLPIIALATPDTCTRDTALLAGCTDFDTRPLDEDRLLSRIGRCLAADHHLPERRATPASHHADQPSPWTSTPAAPSRQVDDEGVLLIVDAQADRRGLVARRFERCGFRALQAASGAEALAMLSLDAVELVLLDMQSDPGASLRALHQIRLEDAATPLPVVMVAARDRPGPVHAALDAGANDCISAPIDFAVALTRVRTHLKASRAERALRVSEERYALAALASNDGLFDWNLETDRVYYSERWATLLGVRPERLVPHFSEWISRVHPDEQARVSQELRAHLDGTVPTWESEHRMRHADGHYRWVLARGMTRRTQDGRPVRLAGSLSDVTHAKVADPLTGLPNRLLFLERMHHALQGARTDERPRFAVLFADLDGFKMVNDSLGHVAGDDLLVQVARRLETGVRKSDFAGHLSMRRTLSRLGGDEFAVLLEDISDAPTALAVADRLQAAFQEAFLLDGRPVYCSLSIGIVLDAPRYTCGEELMRDADAAMYRAKKRGRGQSEIFTDAALAEARLQSQLEEDLRHAIAHDQIVPYYQPIVTLAGGTLEGFEALARWRHPERGLIGPATFVPIAAATGLLAPLTYAVCRRAAAQLREWRGTWPAAATCTMSVNIAPALFREEALVETLLAIVTEQGLGPGDFRLEVVEATLLDTAPVVAERLRALRSAGFALVLDDFGTGYSSLGYLHAFPLTTLKIDRSFVNRMADASDEAVQMVRSIVALAHALGMDVTAEGVETQAQVRWLQTLSCVRGQGFYFERALPPESIAQVLDEPAFLVPDVLPGERVPMEA